MCELCGDVCFVVGTAVGASCRIDVVLCRSSANVRSVAVVTNIRQLTPLHGEGIVGRWTTDCAVSEWLLLRVC